jgi:hypothetical protein
VVMEGMGRLSGKVVLLEALEFRESRLVGAVREHDRVTGISDRTVHFRDFIQRMGVSNEF